MENIKNCRFATIAVICMLLLISGCAEPNGTTKPKIVSKQTKKAMSIPAAKKGPIKLALKFTPGDSATYKVVNEATRQAAWEGLDARKPAGFKGGQSGSRIELTFTQHILSIDEEDNANARITIEELKYLTKVADNTILDFDSTRDTDSNNPLFKLLNQSYTIKITPFGQVIQVSNTDSIQAVFMAATAENKLAIRLLSEDTITERHTISALPAGDKTEFNIGDSWEVVKNISFDQMGIKSFGKTYTLENIRDIDNRRIAVIRMNAIPSAEHAKELYQAQTALPFPFDSTDTYSGQLMLDSENGKVEEYNEKLISEWIIIDPASKNNEKPDSIKMSATQYYSIKKID